jgi:hypothetical protein
MYQRLPSILATIALSTLLATPTLAQAQRTWVSGVGDDANPCSRMEPCLTFAGAISKTAAGGEINVLTAGGFGGVTIIKSITISSAGFEAGVQVSGTNGIVINAAPTDRIVLRGLDLEGLGGGLAGIKVVAAGQVFVEDCTINGFTQQGIDFVPSAAVAATSQLYVRDSIIRNNNGAASGGIHIKPGSNVSALAQIENTSLLDNRLGLSAEGGGGTGVNVQVNGGTISGNQFAGLDAASFSSLGGSATIVTATDTAFVGNKVGLRVQGDAATIFIARTSVAGNSTGLDALHGGDLFSFGNNEIAGNANDGSTPAIASPK